MRPIIVSWLKRRKISVAVLCVCAAVLSVPKGRELAAQTTCLLPSNPATSGIDHIVMIMMENRSFDHLLGWLPNANGQQHATYYTDANNVGPHQTFSFTQSGFTTDGDGQYPAHGYGNLHDTDWAIGPNEGWLRNNNNPSPYYAIGYYNEAEIGFLGRMARQYTALDAYFPSVISQTWPNRKFAHAAQTDTLDNTNNGVSSYQTIWDHLSTAGVSANYYWGDNGGGGHNYLNVFWGSRFDSITKVYSQFISDAQAGALPSVSFVDPGFYDDHPGDGSISQGDDWLNATVTAVMKSPQWQNSVIVITFDEGGGYFDHVPPPRAAAPNGTDSDIVNGKALLGFRVPTIIVSPFTVGQTNNPTVNHLVYDHTSALKMIEWRWNVQPLTARDSSSDINNLACALSVPNLLAKPGFEEDTVPTLGSPGWISDPTRQTPAVSESNTAAHTGLKDAKCSTASALDCGIIQDVVAPSTGTYTFSVFANANRSGGLVGANVNGTTVISQSVAVRTGNSPYEAYGAPYVMPFSANAGDTIRVWMYSPATPGYVVIDDSALTGRPSQTSTGNLIPRSSFEEYTVPNLGPPAWISDPGRQTAARSDTTQPRTGSKEGMCTTTSSLDCGIYQDLTAPATGTYTLSFYANANRSGALVGANINGVSATSSNVQVRTGTYGAPYIQNFSANAGDTIRPWMYSPATPGWLVMDDVTLYPNLIQRPGFEEYSVPLLGPPAWVSDVGRQTAAHSDSTQPHTGSKAGICSTAASQDCGIYQDLTAPTTGTYTLTFYANANRTGGLIGANVNGTGVASSPVQVRGSYGDSYAMPFTAQAGDVIRVWMYSPASPGWLVIDDVSLTQH
jgi:phospholipase C